MGCVSDALLDGRCFRAPTIVGNFTRECLVIEVAPHSQGEDMVADAKCLRNVRALPARTQAYNLPESISKALNSFAYEYGVTLNYRRPGEPKDDPYIESFNGSLRDECVNTHRFISLEDLREKIGSWRVDYNYFRLHSPLADKMPALFADTIRITSAVPNRLL